LQQKLNDIHNGLVFKACIFFISDISLHQYCETVFEEAMMINQVQLQIQFMFTFDAFD